MNLIDIAYLILFIPLSPIILFYLLEKKKFSIIKTKFSPKIKPGNKKKLWFNAVSVGEVKSLRSIINHFEKKGYEIVLTITTTTGFKIAKDLFSRNITILYSPIDLSFVIKRFIKGINPLIFITNELEIWPNLLKILNKRKIPMILINGRISDNALKRYKVIRFITSSMLNKFDRILVQSESYKNRFNEFIKNEKKIKICGNFKMDQAIKDSKKLENNSYILKQLKIKKTIKPILVLASSHYEEEKLLLDSIKELLKEFSIIVVPRHFNRIENFKKECNKINVKVKIWSKSQEIDLDNEVMIYDKMGYLLNIIKISDFVFMGGTLNPSIGGHSFYEPSVLKKPVISGKYYNNFKEIAEDMISNNVLYIVQNSEDFIKRLKELKDKDISLNLFDRIIENRKGAINCTINEIENLIK